MFTLNDTNTTRLGFLPFKQPSIYQGHNHKMPTPFSFGGNGPADQHARHKMPTPFSFGCNGPVDQHAHQKMPSHFSFSGNSPAAQHTPSTTHEQWDSAGVIVIDDKFHNSQGAIFQTIFLFFDHKNDVWRLAYGSRDKSDKTSVSTAQRNCLENMSNLFRFGSKSFDDAKCVVSPDNRQKAYIIRVTEPKHGIHSKIFYTNSSIVRSTKAPDSWTQVSAITRIGIKEAIVSGILTHPNKSNFQMFDVYGNSITIFWRDADFIRDAIKAKLNVYSPVHTLRLITSYDDKFNGNKNCFLNKTSCYMVIKK